MVNRKKIALLIIVTLVIIFVSGCIPGDGNCNSEHPAGFFSGIWHGWIAPLSLIIGIFKPGIRIYETANTGWGYDFGFYMAIISGFGGLSLSRRKKVSHQEKIDQ
jgi:hypothetical protein